MKKSRLAMDSKEVKKICCITAEGTNPYRNIAIEEYLLEHVEAGCCILYLWQNQKTVVIGRNQNPWKECKVTLLEEDGGHLARRLSGGGAVFHDLGNLNFTFIAAREVYDVQRQLSVIVEACRSLGIAAEKTGRNDITVQGKKFSGNAFYETEKSCYHHGTLLLQVNREDMARYLHVDKDKLEAKGVSSVQSRVTNLTEYCPQLTVAKMKEKLIAAFSSIYGMAAGELEEKALPQEAINAKAAFFASSQWKYGKHLPFTVRLGQRFSWGDADLRLQVEKGVVKEACLYSDGMDETFLLELACSLAECPFKTEAMIQRFDSLLASKIDRKASALRRQMAEDLKGLIAKREL